MDGLVTRPGFSTYEDVTRIAAHLATKLKPAR